MNIPLITNGSYSNVSSIGIYWELSWTKHYASHLQLCKCEKSFLSSRKERGNTRGEEKDFLSLIIYICVRRLSMVVYLILDCKEIQTVHSKGDQPWVFFGRNDAKAETPVLWPPSCEELTHWKRLWCWEGLGARGEGDNRGWDGWMASLTWWTWVWVNSGSWWWTGRPGVLRFMGLQRVGHDWMTELNWTDSNYIRWELLPPWGKYSSVTCPKLQIT